MSKKDDIILDAFKNIGKCVDGLSHISDMAVYEYDSNGFDSIFQNKNDELKFREVKRWDMLGNRWYLWFNCELGSNFIYIGKPVDIVNDYYNGFWKSSKSPKRIMLANDRPMPHVFQDIYEIPQRIAVEIEKIYNKLLGKQDQRYVK